MPDAKAVGADGGPCRPRRARCGAGLSDFAEAPTCIPVWQSARLTANIALSNPRRGACRGTLRRVRLQRVVTMTKKSLLMSMLAASFYAVLPAQAQVIQPDPSQPGGFPLKPGSAKTLIQERCV